MILRDIITAHVCKYKELNVGTVRKEPILNKGMQPVFGRAIPKRRGGGCSWFVGIANEV